MRVARILAPITTLGPGNRVGVWVQGCKRCCKDCISPEMQFEDINREIPLEILIKLIGEAADRDNCSGLTISGGEPFEQCHELGVLLKAVRGRFDDILVYTGYMYSEIQNSKDMRKCLDYIDVLIDGPYINKDNTADCVLRGSRNQGIIYLKEDIENSYIEYMKNGRRTESFTHGNTIISVGIQGRGIEA